jgi:hypothetical protein
MNRLLLFTDLDRTLLPNGPQPESPDARPRFARLAAADGVRVAYVSGRGIGLVEEAVDRWNLPVPDLVIGDVGTTIASPAADGWHRWTTWDDRLAAAWAGLARADLMRSLSHLTALIPQGDIGQGRFKISYFTPAGPAGRETTGQARRILDDNGLQVNAVWSMDETQDRGLLDILPAPAGKRPAIEHVLQEWDIPRDRVMFAGDSGNDLDVLASHIPAVLVANARAEVRDEARELAAKTGNEAALHIAEGGPLGMNGNYAAGILDGVLHFHPQLAGLLEENA